MITLKMLDAENGDSFLIKYENEHSKIRNILIDAGTYNTYYDHVSNQYGPLKIEIDKIQQEIIPERELQKVKNRVESMLAFEDMELLNRANNLAFYELMGDAELMNKEFSNYEAITTEDLHREAQQLFDEKNSNTIYYYADK